MKFKSREQQAAVMMQYPYTRKKKNRTFARRSTSSKIHTTKINKPVIRHLWEGDPEGHSEAAILGWELRKYGFRKVPQRENNKTVSERKVIVYHNNKSGQWLGLMYSDEPAKPFDPKKKYPMGRYKGPGFYAYSWDKKYNENKPNGKGYSYGPFKSIKEAKLSLLSLIITGV